jgi:hypothetical protein
MPTAQDAAAKLIHKAATVTFNNPHIARAINTWLDKIKTKRKRRKIPSYYAKYAYKAMKA